MKAIVSILTGATVFVAACNNVAVGQSTVNLSLNLHYTDTANPTLGGSWYLVAKTNASNGIASIDVYLNHIHATGIVYGNGGVPNGCYPASVTSATLGALLNNGQPFVSVFGGAVNLLYGQDGGNGPIILDVGQGSGTPGNIPADPLRNTAWNNSALIAKGTFGANTPVFTSVSGRSTDANVYTNSSTTPGSNFTADANVTTLVRQLTPLTGDYNCNCAIDAGDYVVWRKRNGTAQEYIAWRSQFGQPAGSGSGVGFDSSDMINVAEPGAAVVATVLVWTAACLGLTRRRWR